MKPSFENGVHAGLQAFFSEVFAQYRFDDLASLALLCKAAKVHLAEHIEGQLSSQGKLSDLEAMGKHLGIELFDEFDSVLSFKQLWQMADDFAANGDVQMPVELCELVGLDPYQNFSQTQQELRQLANSDEERGFHGIHSCTA